MLAIAAVMMCSLPANSYAATSKISIDDKAVLYTPNSDYRSGDCILSSSKTMVRRAAILRGSKVWSKTTNASIRKDATIFGLLLHNFTHNTDGLAYTVRCGFFKGKTDAARIEEFKKLIKQHPEGVVVWGSRASIFGQHGVLLTGVKNNVPYVADSYYNRGPRSKGIQKWEDSTMKSPVLCTQYWYIKQVSLAKGAKEPAKGKPLAPISASEVNTASTLKISDATQPSEVSMGSGYPVAGVIESNYRISSVTVSIVNSAGKAVISKSAKPKAWVYDLDALDRDVKFGTLPAGTYKYQVKAKDEKKSATLINASFKVVDAKTTSTLKIKSYTAPTTINQGHWFNLRGKITSNRKISKVSVKVVDSAGKTVLSASAKPNKTSYNIKKIDHKIKFGKLSRGQYTYKVTARDALQSKTLVKKKFTVK